eukprot:3725073-Pleurochrysis_carterae.AAC.1
MNLDVRTHADNNVCAVVCAAAAAASATAAATAAVVTAAVLAAASTAIAAVIVAVIASVEDQKQRDGGGAADGVLCAQPVVELLEGELHRAKNSAREKKNTSGRGEKHGGEGEPSGWGGEGEPSGWGGEGESRKRAKRVAEE